ncbi:MAG: cytochrome c biogenesis protein ResB [Candidatus Omnitrophica bacterium]|nr:cytochrome c biogenesis protein ResB [Candidatus Omnitrophota bacterium]
MTTRTPLHRLTKTLGSLTVAVPLIIAIAIVLAWGTIYEARFGTASVQQFIYRSWWFQLLLGFLAVNLAIVAASRYPWKKHHAPFVLAHLGIICILLGGVLGGRFGVDGQMIIPEGQAEQVIESQSNVIVVHVPDEASARPPDAHGHAQADSPTAGAHQIIPTSFETQAWVQEPNATFMVSLSGRTIQLTVDRFYPDVITTETVTDDGADDHPAVQVRISHHEQQDEFWLLARDAERFGTGWGEAHVLFLEAETDAQLKRLTGEATETALPRGMLSVTVPGLSRPQQMPVPAERNLAVNVPGTPYSVTFKDYFPDFAITEEGVISRSETPNNPAISFILSGPEGTDAYLLFALHPDFQSMHGFKHAIPAQVSYTHAAGDMLPPNAIAILRTPSKGLMAVLTGSDQQRQVIKPLALNTDYTQAPLGYTFRLLASYPRARLTETISNRSNEIHAEAIHVIGTEGSSKDEAWVLLRNSAELQLDKGRVVVEFRPDQRKLPVTIKLLDFRKITYPGTSMASGFEADVQLSDPERGVILMKKISMNNPLRYRGYHFYQSSYIDGPTQTTVLSVRNDPGTPLVYAGFLVVVAGMVSMFILRRKAPVISGKAGRRRRA